MRITIARLLRRREQVYYGWWIVAIGSVITCIGSIYFYGSSVFFLPLSRELGLSRTAISVIFSTARLEGSIEGPFIGWLTDKAGPQKMVVAGALIAAIGFLALATVHSFWALFLVFTGLLAIGFNMGFFPAMVVAANNWFVYRRTVAISILAASFRLGASVLTPLLALVVLNYGWRIAAVSAGVLIFVGVIPLSFFIRRSPESMGLLPDGRPLVKPELADPDSGKGQSLARRTPRDYGVREALKTPAYWLVAFANGLRLGAFAGTVVHMVPIFVWRGLSEQMGANLVGATALVGLPLTLVLGVTADRFNKQAIMVLGSCSSALAMLLLALVPGLWPAVFFVVLFALGESIGPINWSILGDLFGRRNFATLRGGMLAFGVIGAAMPVYIGWVFDQTQSYTIALITMSFLSGAAAVMYFLLLLLRRRQLAVVS